MSQEVVKKAPTVKELNKMYDTAFYVAMVVLPLTAAGVIYVWHSILNP